MHRLKERFRRLKGKPRNSDSDASLDLSTAQDGDNQRGKPTPSNAIPASRTSEDVVPTPASSVLAVSKAQSALEPHAWPTSIAMHDANLPEHLWDRAYDELKKSEIEATVVQAYEKILSHHLRTRDPMSDSDIDEENIIAQDDPGARRAQMKRLVTSGLAKIKRETKIKESINNGLQVILSAKDVISSAIQAVPQAALAWTGVCLALEIFGNSTSATKANRDGIDYVIQRMEWYWELPDTVQRENAGVYDHLSKMKGGLEAQLIGLYKLLLLYQMKSVCSYYKNRGLVFLRDIAKLDDWDGDIKAVEKAEAIFYKDSDVHRKEKMNANLEQIVTYVKQKMTKEDLQCFKDLGITDPSYDKKRIESTKGGLLEQSYRWVLDNPDFQRWRDDEERRLLWIRGDPGKGKTMLLCGIANELRRTPDCSGFVSYFFCQATDRRINNANAVLWGLMFMLVNQQPVLMHHIRNKYDASGKDLFLGANSWFALSEIFSDMLRDPALTHAYLLIDALDECTSDREKLLDLVFENLSASSRVKWILSSRNWPEIERQLAQSEGLERISLSLEVNADLVSRAVDAYIEHEISQLHLMKYHPTLKDQIQQQMQKKANGTFLWVALVVKDLRDRQDAEYEDPLYILNTLMETPGDLTSLYSHMVAHIVKLKGDTPNLCKRILSVATLASRPLSLAELRILAGFDSNRINDQAVERLVNKCGSFLTIRDCTIYFVHQSAKDHLILDIPTQPIIFPSGHSEVHYTIFSHSLRAMSSILDKNIYKLSHPGAHIDEIEIPDPDPLATIRYSCAYWIDHLRNGILTYNGTPIHQNWLDDTGPVYLFLCKHFLHWLEALSLQRKLSDNVLLIIELKNLLETQLSQTQLVRFLHDCYRFILYFIRAIESAPLQVYSSALIFSPMQSLVRQTFHKDSPSSVHTKPFVDDTWNPCLQILETGSLIRGVAFSADNKLAAISSDRGFEIWHIAIATGAFIRTFSDYTVGVLSQCFLNDGRLASGTHDGAIRIWDLAAGTCIQTLEGHEMAVMSIIALADEKLASESWDQTIKIWDIATGTCVQTLEGKGRKLPTMINLGDNKLAWAFGNEMIKIWDVASGLCVQTLNLSDAVVATAALADNKLASASLNETVEIWDIATGKYVQTLKGHLVAVMSFAVFPDNKLASGSLDGMIKIWDIATGVCILTLESYDSQLSSVIALADNKLASVSRQSTIRIWDTSAGAEIPTLKGHSGRVRSVAFSGDGKQMASGSDDSTVKIWDTATGICLQTLEGHESYVNSVSFSGDGKLIASAANDCTVKIWHITASIPVWTLKGHTSSVDSVAFSANGKQLVSVAGNLKIWDTATGICIQTFEYLEGWMKSVALSEDGRRAASTSNDKIKIWDTGTGLCVQTLEGHSDWIRSVALSKDGRWVASGSNDKAIKIWDTATGMCVQTLHVGVATQLSFHKETAHRLQTDYGILDLDPEAVINEPLSETSITFTGCGMNEARSWLKKDGKPVLWLPVDYRPEALAITGSTVGIGTESGRVLVFQLSELDRFSV